MPYYEQYIEPLVSLEQHTQPQVRSWAREQLGDMQRSSEREQKTIRAISSSDRMMAARSSFLPPSKAGHPRASENPGRFKGKEKVA